MYCLAKVFKKLKLAVVGVLFVVLTACSTSSSLVKTYEGDILPENQLAVLIAPENIEIISVNGSAVSQYLLSNIETRYGLKPGSNLIVFKYKSLWAKPGPKVSGSARSELTESVPMSVSYDAKAGQIYNFAFARAANVREARVLAADFSADLTDVNNVIVGKAKPFAESVSDVSMGMKVEDVVSTQSTAGEQASRLASLKKIWNSATPKERKAFLAWAFKE